MEWVVTSGIWPDLGPHEYLEWGPTKNRICKTELCLVKQFNKMGTSLRNYFISWRQKLFKLHRK